MKVLKCIVSIIMTVFFSHAAEITQNSADLLSVLKLVQFENLEMILDEIDKNPKGLQSLAIVNKEFKKIVLEYIKFANNRANLRAKYLPSNNPVVIHGKLYSENKNNGFVLYNCGEDLLILDTKRNKAYQIPTGKYNCIEFDPNGYFMVAVPINTKSIEKIEIDTGKILEKWETKEYIQKLTLLSNNQIVKGISTDLSEHYWYLNGDIVNENALPDLLINKVNKKTTPKYILSRNKLLNTHTKENIILPGENDLCNRYHLSPDETYIVFGRMDENCSNATIKIYESNSGTCLKEWTYTHILDNEKAVFISDNSNVIYKLYEGKCVIFSLLNELQAVLYKKEQQTALPAWQILKNYILWKPLLSLIQFMPNFD